MRFFYNNLYNNKQHYHRLFNAGKDMFNAFCSRHSKILIHAGVGGKNHIMEKGHVTWNRKGRW